VKKSTLLLLGAGALALYFLTKKDSEASVGGGGATDSNNALSGLIEAIKKPLTTFGSEGNNPQFLQPANPSYSPTLSAQLAQFGATPAAITTQTVGAGAMLAGSSYAVSNQGGIVKTLANYGGYEAISPSGMGYSTASIKNAASIATGGNPNPPKVVTGLLSGSTSKYFK
jgi:hypothetical protein